MVLVNRRVNKLLHAHTTTHASKIQLLDQNCVPNAHLEDVLPRRQRGKRRQLRIRPAAKAVARVYPTEIRLTEIIQGTFLCVFFFTIFRAKPNKTH